MPVVTPAEDHTLPSRTNIASGSTATCGCRVASNGACIQWVAARRPSNTPAAASRKLPMHTEHTRLHLGACLPDPLNQIAVTGHIVHQKSARHDQRIDLRPAQARTESVTSATPSAVFTGPPRTETTEHSYVPRSPPGPGRKWKLRGTPPTVLRGRAMRCRRRQ